MLIVHDCTKYLKFHKQKRLLAMERKDKPQTFLSKDVQQALEELPLIRSFLIPDFIIKIIGDMAEKFRT